MSDKFLGLDDISSPAISGFAVTNSDSTIFAPATRGLYIGGGGDLTVRMIDGTQLDFVGVPTGTLLPIRVDKVLTTGTSATNIVGLY